MTSRLFHRAFAPESPDYQGFFYSFSARECFVRDAAPDIPRHTDSALMNHTAANILHQGFSAEDCASRKQRDLVDSVRAWINIRLEPCACKTHILLYTPRHTHGAQGPRCHGIAVLRLVSATVREQYSSPVLPLSLSPSEMSIPLFVGYGEMIAYTQLGNRTAS